MTNSEKRVLFTQAHRLAGKRRQFQVTASYRQLMSLSLKEGYRSRKCVNVRGDTSLKYRAFWGGEPEKPAPVERVFIDQEVFSI